METKTKVKVPLIVLSKYDQTVIAADIFEKYPKAQKVLVASDGQAFITDEGEGAAKNHAKNNRYGKVLDLILFTREGILQLINDSKSVEGTDTSKEVEDTDTSNKVDDADTSKKVEDTDASKKIEPSNTTK